MGESRRVPFQLEPSSGADNISDKWKQREGGWAELVARTDADVGREKVRVKNGRRVDRIGGNLAGRDEGSLQDRGERDQQRSSQIWTHERRLCSPWH